MLKEIKSQEEYDVLAKSDRENGTDYLDNITICPHCGRSWLIDYTEAEINNLIKWSERKLLIQDALPSRTPYERELMRYAWSGLPMIQCCEECDGGF